MGGWDDFRTHVGHYWAQDHEEIVFQTQQLLTLA